MEEYHHRLAVGGEVAADAYGWDVAETRLCPQPIQRPDHDDFDEPTRSALSDALVQASPKSGIIEEQVRKPKPPRLLS